MGEPKGYAKGVALFYFPWSVIFLKRTKITNLGYYNLPHVRVEMLFLIKFLVPKEEKYN